MVTRSLSASGETLRIDPARILFKISPLEGLQGSVDGAWDIERRHRLDEAVKHRAIAQRYSDGARWEETDLFRDVYSRRLRDGGSVRGCRDMPALLAQYYSRVDGMFADLRRRGFDVKAGPLPTLLVGRGGEVFIGNQGNHRLAMAQVLRLPEITGKVICRHSLTPAALSRR